MSSSHNFFTTGTYTSLLGVVENCNSFKYDEDDNTLYRFIAPTAATSGRKKDSLIGLVRSCDVAVLEQANTLVQVPPLDIDKDQRTIKFSRHYADAASRSEVMRKVLGQLRVQQALPTLAKWRDEQYPIYDADGLHASIERAASYTFGIRTYGVHINGYVRCNVDEAPLGLKVWIARRSSTKQTWPGYLDQMVAGGISTELGMMETVIKECEEEAGIGPELASKAKPVGTIQYFTQSEYGLQPETQYVYDLELLPNVDPRPNDGESEGFYLLALDEIKNKLLNGEFKPNCAVCMIDFMIRHGYISAEDEPHYLAIIDNLHCSLPMPGIHFLK
ncbi:hypothetical protein EV182_000215 [Spiromyces aspiralis]|uniref:Uncharacterized protein n=1 Tax=Spiromyces aspiralis TaxID=68401 RepID=A0ACC1HIC3_9FUNG|nr:hypothetical protein EV182_000215 [Spiromyces aspiralis]